MARYGIVGGGMLGMTLALRLSDAGHDVTIIEAAERCGGLASPWQLGDVIWDRHYHVTLNSDSFLRAVLDEIGMSGDMRWVTTRTGFFVDGRMYSMSDVGEFFRFPPLSTVEKVRLAATIFGASRITDWRPLEQVTAVDWLTRYSGRNTVEKMWLPLLRAKLGDYAERASAAFIWAIIVRMYAARRTGMKRELFGYAAGGYDRILDRFEERLRSGGVRILTGCRSQTVQRTGTGVAVFTGNGVYDFDRVIVTLAAPLAARLCPQLSHDERERCHGRRVPRHRLRFAAQRCADNALLRHEHHGSLGTVHCRYRNDRAGGPRRVRRKVADLSAQICHTRRPDLYDLRRRHRERVYLGTHSHASELFSQARSCVPHISRAPRSAGPHGRVFRSSASDANLRTRIVLCRKRPHR